MRFNDILGKPTKEKNKILCTFSSQTVIYKIKYLRKNYDSATICIFM